MDHNKSPHTELEQEIMNNNKRSYTEYKQQIMGNNNRKHISSTIDLSTIVNTPNNINQHYNTPII